MNINLDRQGRVVSFGESLHKRDTQTSPKLVMQDQDSASSFSDDVSADMEAIDVTEAVAVLARHLNLPVAPREQVSVQEGISLKGESHLAVSGFDIGL